MHFMGVSNLINKNIFNLKNRHVRNSHMPLIKRKQIKTKKIKIDINQEIISNADSLAERHA